MKSSKKLITTYCLKGVNLSKTSAYEIWWQDGYDVALGETYIWTSTRDNNRRSSIQ
ncbi:MAG: hypothetical protein Q8P90_02575 [bacterium]|nr:hypothetical protein [bacterium]